MSSFYAAVPAMLEARGIVREDSYDYGTWWRDDLDGVYRLTWVGGQWREDPARAGELYLVRVSGPHVATVWLRDVAAHPSLSLAPADCAARMVALGGPVGPVELLCVLSPAAEGQPDALVETLLEGWADVCGEPGSVRWIRDRVWEALRAGWARQPDRYVVEVVYPDGNPRRLGRYDTLAAALARRDAEDVRRGGSRRGYVLLVYDGEDPERGYLDDDDLEEGRDA